MSSRPRVPRPALAAALLLAGLAAAPAAGADWNTGVGRNAARDGLSPEVGPTTPAPLWQGSRTAIVAQQGVAAADLFVVPRIQNFTIPTGTWIVAHELATGAERWAVQLPYDPDNPGHRSRVHAIRDGQVYATRAGNTKLDFLYALDPANGSILWTSEARIGEETTESPSFAPNGDLVIGNFDSLRRIDHLDGTTVWDAPRSCPTSNGCSAAVFGSRVYIWEAGGQGPVVTAFDLATGQRLYSSPGVGGGFVQQLGLLVGPDGTVYAPRTQNNPATDFFVTFEDNGTALVEKWRRPLGYVPFASFGIGPDGSVYSYTPALEIVRLDPATGQVLDTSDPIPADFPMQPRMAIDADGKLFVTNGGFGQGALFSFDADLTLRWSVSVPNVNVGGPVLAGGGVLLVCGTGTDVRAYRTTDTSDMAGGAAPGHPAGIALAHNVPNPFNPTTEIRFELPAAAAALTLEVFDAGGRRVRTLIAGEARAAGGHRVAWDGRDERGAVAGSGLYVSRLTAGGEVVSRKMLLVR